MASSRPEDPLKALLGPTIEEGLLTDGERTLLVAHGFCPFCMGNDENPKQTIVDHCFEEQATHCREGWLRCEECGAYGRLDRFIGGG